MKTIMLVCSAGMSTSLLVTKMEDAAKKKGLEVKIFAVSEADAKNHFEEIDVLLLGPQVRFLKKKMEKSLEGMNIPIDVIDSMDYGTMNGDSVLSKAIALI